MNSAPAYIATLKTVFRVTYKQSNLTLQELIFAWKSKLAQVYYPNECLFTSPVLHDVKKAFNI